MIKKFLALLLIIFLVGISIDSQSHAQYSTPKESIDKVKEVNDRIDAEYLKQFAAQRKLYFSEIPEIATLEERLNQKEYKGYSFKAQQKVGKALLEKFLDENTLFLNDPHLTKYVASVGKLVASQMGDQTGYLFTFGIIDDPAVKIYTFPGGYIFVTKGYLKAIENEAQLAASLAREISNINDNYLMETLIENKEAITLLASLNNVLNENITIKKSTLSEKEKEDAKKLFSDPYESLDYFAAPTLENLFTNKDFLSKKLLKKMLMIIPPYETIVEKDRVALKALQSTGYDEESIKDLIIVINKQQKEVQVINRSINIENWLGEKTLKKTDRNKVEGRYVMMLERLTY